MMWVTRAKSNTVYTVQSVLLQTSEVCDRVVLLGGANPRCRQPVRLIEVRFGQTGYRYLTRVLLPFDCISLEMVFCGLYHFMQAYAQGEATDLVKCLATLENRDLGVVKRSRKKLTEPNACLLNP